MWSAARGPPKGGLRVFLGPKLSQNCRPVGQLYSVTYGMRVVMLICLLIAALNANGQKHDNIWLFGLGVGLDFSNANGTNLPVPFVNPVHNFETVGCFSDSAGQLKVAYKGEHRIEWQDINWWSPHFVNGEYEPIEFQYASPDTLFTYADGYSAYLNDSISNSSSQSMLFLPRPGGTDTLDAILFLSFAEPDNSIRNNISSLRFVKKDSEYYIDGSLLPVAESSPGNYFHLERLVAIRHANGEDWWLIAHRSPGKVYEVMLFNSGQILSRSLQNVGLLSVGLSGDVTGEMVPSPDGTKLLLQMGGGD